MPGGPPLWPGYSGPSGVLSEPRKVPARTFPVFGLVGIFLGQSEPFSSVTSGGSSSNCFYDFQSSGNGVVISHAVEKSVRSSGLAAQISELNLHKLLGTIVPLLPVDVHSLLQLPQATLLALDWWTNLSASSSLSRSKGLLLQSYCGQMLAKQVWGGGGRDQSGSWVAGSWGPNLLGST